MDGLRDMIGCEGEAFSNGVLQFTRQYWFQCRGNLNPIDPWWIPLDFQLSLCATDIGLI